MVCLKVFRDFVRKVMILVRFEDFEKIKWKKNVSTYRATAETMLNFLTNESN